MLLPLGSSSKEKTGPELNVPSLCSNYSQVHATITTFIFLHCNEALKLCLFQYTGNLLRLAFILYFSVLRAKARLDIYYMLSKH